MKKILLLALFPILIFATPLTKTDYKNLQKYKTREHVLYEKYLESDKGPVSVIGYHFDSFYMQDFYYTLTIFGAIEGERGGYGIAAVGLGYSKHILPNLYLDIKAVVGSGGGGGLQAGGGLAYEYMYGIGLEIVPDIFIEIKTGHLKFPTGTFKTDILNIGFTFQYDAVFLP